MICSLLRLKSKEVINTSDGQCLGYIDDLEFDIETGRVVSLVIFGRPRFLGLFGKEENLVLSVEDVELIGKDAVLVRYSPSVTAEGRRKKRFFFGKAQGD